MSIVPYPQPADTPKRRSLDQTQVVRAALALLDEVGLDELTMRRLADRLNVKAASLYRHIRNKQELLVLLADEIIAEMPAVSPEGPWPDRLREMAWNARRALVAHRDGARVLAETPPMGPRRLRQIESILRILRSAGLTSQEAARSAYHLNNFVTEFAADEARLSAFAASAGTTPGEVQAQARQSFRSLPPDTYPTIVEMADALTEDKWDALFEFGVEMWIRGLESLLDRRC